MNFWEDLVRLFRFRLIDLETLLIEMCLHSLVYRLPIDNKIQVASCSQRTSFFFILFFGLACTLLLSFFREEPAAVKALA